jgi:hypothetical protein
MDRTETRLDWVTGITGAATGVGVLMFALFPLAIPFLLLTILATLPLALPLIAVAAIVTILFVAGQAVRAAIHVLSRLGSAATNRGDAGRTCPSS